MEWMESSFDNMMKVPSNCRVEYSKDLKHLRFKRLPRNHKKIFFIMPKDLIEAQFTHLIGDNSVLCMDGPIKCTSSSGGTIYIGTYDRKINKEWRTNINMYMDLLVHDESFSGPLKATLHKKNAIALNGLKVFVMSTDLPLETRDYLRNRICELFNKGFK